MKVVKKMGLFRAGMIGIREKSDDVETLNRLKAREIVHGGECFCDIH